MWLTKSSKYLFVLLMLVPLGLVGYRIAGYLGWTSEDVPNAPESSALFLCAQCGHVFSLTARQLADAPMEISAGPDTSVRLVRVKCLQCAATAGERAVRCLKDGTVYPLFTNGARQSCPVCAKRRSDTK